MIRSPIIRLSNGLKMPQFGLGTWLSEKGKVQTAVEDAIDLGYRQIDCAWVYGNEDEVGAAIKNKINEGVVKREDLFIVSKLWNIFHQPDQVQRALDLSLKELDLDYLDLYLMHFPVGFKNIDDNPFPVDKEKKRAVFDEIDYVITYNEMEKLVGDHCKGLGVSNYNEFQISRLLENSSHKPLVNQIESNPYHHNQQLIDHCKGLGVEIMAYSPLGNPAAPPTRKWEEDTVPLIQDPVVGSIGESYGKTSAQVLIRYAIERGLIVIPKSVTKSRLAANADVFDFELSENDLARLKDLERGFKVVELAANKDHKYYPFRDNYSE